MLKRALLLPLLLLAGCSDEPSEEAMRAQVEAHTRATLKQQGRGISGFSDFRKQGCVSSKSVEGAYDCYYAATIPATAGAPATAVNGKGRFRRTDQGLEFKDLGAQPR